MKRLRALANPDSIRIIVGCFLLALTTTASSAQTKDLILILDGSGSMWGQINGVNKIVIAREVLGQLIADLPEDGQTGLIAYGHRREGDCSDIETLIPVSPTDKPRLTASINAVNPKGKTPITQSIRQAVDLTRQRDTPTSIILISDGLETCHADPCQAVADAKASGAPFVLHVVGFDLGKENAASLECVAQQGDGRYFDAQNADELAAALQQAVELPTEVTGGVFSLKAIANGELADAMVRVIDPATQAIVAEGRTYVSPQTNPRQLRLPAGTYRVDVKALRMQGDIWRQFENVAILDHEITEKAVDFSTGTLSVKVLINGQLGDAAVKVTNAGGRQTVAQGRTYIGDGSNPQRFELTPGRYDLVVKPISFAGGQEKRFDGLEIKAGENIERLAEYGTGKLSVKVTANGELADATVTAYDRASGKAVDQSRSYTSSKHNPVIFELPAGSYDLAIKAVKVNGDTGHRIDNVSVAVGEKAEHGHDYQTGTLQVEVTHAGEPTDAILTIIERTRGESVAAGRSYGRPKSFALLVGEYIIKARAVKKPGAQAVEVPVTVEQAQTTQNRIALPAAP